MPFPVHLVTPVRMSDTRIPPDTENKLESVTNTTLCQAIRQLASILRQAEDLFQDLGSECVKIHERTERINKRIGTLGVTVAAFNPRKQKIPAGDLVSFSRLKAHYTTSYSLDTELFTRASRTVQVQALYEAARDKAEPQVQRDVSGMMIMPYFSEDCDARKNNMNVDIESCLPRNYEEFTSGMMVDRLRDSSVISTVDGVTGTGEVVVVDVSGKTFNRMTDYRRSLQPSVTTRRKRSKRRHRGDRRNTLAGGEKFQEKQRGEPGEIMRENKNRSRSQEDGRLGRPHEDGVKDDMEDVSLNVTGCSSSLLTVTLPDLSANTSYEARTVSELSCPPNMPLLHTTGEEIRRLRQSLAPTPIAMSPSCSDKDRETESYYESLGSVTRRSVDIKGRRHPDGALSSSGVWTASVSDGSDKETDTMMTPGKTEVVEVHKVRPKSSLSMGVVSDTESLEREDNSAREEVETEAESPTLMGENNIPFMDDADESVHSCDTEGYYTTFHDFDGFQEVANEYNFDFEIPNSDVKQTVEEESDLKRQQEVVYRKKSRSETRPSPPRRHSSLLRDRESTDTVILVTDLVKIDTEKPRNSLLDFSGTESDIEVAKHLTSTSLTARFIPSLCVVTPPVSDTASVINMSRSTSESPGLPTPTPKSSGDTPHEESDSVTATDNTCASSSPSDVSEHSTELGDSGKSQASTETVSSMSGEVETNRLSVTSTSSSVTTASGKLVSTTPDIVKPVKEIGDNKDKVKEVIDKAATKDVMVTGNGCDNKILQSSSGSHLPDMLSHTPEMAAAETQSDANPSSATKPDTGTGVVTTSGLSGVTSVCRHQPVSQCGESGPKLRISQPFAPYRDITAPLTRHNTRANEKGDEHHHHPPPPSTLSDQGELLRRVEEQQTSNKINSDPVKTSPTAVKERSGLLQRSPLRKGATPCNKQSSLETDDTGTGEEQSNLKRSDSYRNAKTILSPNLSQINRKSPEISPNNRIENATYVSFNNITSDKSSSPTMMNEGSLNTTAESRRDDKEKPKQNFFRNIRSQFSTLSLRRKSSKKHESDKSAVRDKLQTPPKSKSELRRRNSFNSLLRLSGKTPDQPPRLTSTPINSADKSPPTKSQSEPRSRARQHPVNDWKNSPKQPQNLYSNICHPEPVEDPEFQSRFLTAAVKKQHQRNSYAEPLYHQPHGSHSALYGYVQPPRSLPPPPYHPPPHHYPPSHYQPPLYSNYPQQPGSQRSSVSSIYGLYQGPSSGPSSYYGSLSRVGGHVSRVSPGPGHVSRVSPGPGHVSRADSSPPHSDMSGSAASSSLSLNNIRQRRPLVTSEHSRETRGDFVSPSSDYYSLSPASPTPGVTPSSTAESINTNVPQQQPIYARVVKSKHEEEGLVHDEANEANDVINKISEDKHLRASPQIRPVPLVRAGSSASKKPLAPARSTNDRADKPDSRRHSWAGDKKGPVTPKKTSLHDFKKLLAQQSLSPNPHRLTARELLERSAKEPAKAGGTEPVYGASPGKPAGSLRKRTSPWVDKRFSVIQEEVEGSRENIIE